MDIEAEGQAHLLSDEIKWAIVFKKKKGEGDREVARALTAEYNKELSHQTVHRIWTKYETTKTVSNNWSSQGRPKALNQHSLDLLADCCTTDRMISVNDRRNNLNIKASTSTVNRALNDMGLKAYKAPKKPVLTEENIKIRLKWAQEHRDWTVDDWKNVVFSDESGFQLVYSNGRLWVRRTEDEAWSEDVLQPYSGDFTGVMIWGAISSEGPGPLVRVQGRMNAIAYVDFFRHRLRRYYPELYGGSMMFQQDNHPVHTAKSTMKWFEGKDIDCLDWPPQSPDLNIIENVWGWMKYEFRTRVYKDADELWLDIKELWAKIPLDFIETLYESMPRRIEAVIQAKGGNTKY